MRVEINTGIGSAPLPNARSHLPCRTRVAKHFEEHHSDSQGVEDTAPRREWPDARAAAPRSCGTIALRRSLLRLSLPLENQAQTPQRRTQAVQTSACSC